MGKLTIDEVIGHCERTVERFEKQTSRATLEKRPIGEIFIKEYWEHRQVAEWLKELQALKDKQEQGLLIELPVAIGETVYRINEFAENPIIPMAVISFEINGITNTFKKIKCKELGFGGEWFYRFTDIGKTLFLTSSEAEEALAKMGGANE